MPPLDCASSGGTFSADGRVQFDGRSNQDCQNPLPESAPEP